MLAKSPAGCAQQVLLMSNSRGIKGHQGEDSILTVSPLLDKPMMVILTPPPKKSGSYKS
jgi:hypothetical protein